MKCLAIGDAMIPAKYFDEVLADCPLFDRYESISFLENLPRNDVRHLVREMETKGPTYYPVPAEVFDKIRDADVLFLHMFPVPAALIEAAQNLKYIMTARGGVENIDTDTAKVHNVQIINCPAHNAVAVAEYTIGLILDETRNISRANRELKQGQWREHFPNSQAIPELRTSTVGIVGFGTIGRLVAQRLQGFGSRILVYDPYVPAENIAAAGCESSTLDDLLAASDIVTLHGRLPAGAPPLIGERELGRMKPSAYLINTARAVLVDTDALAKALADHTIMGAAIDVFPEEPLPEGFPLCSLDNITITNHRGGDTLNSYIKAPELLISQMQQIVSASQQAAARL